MKKRLVTRGIVAAALLVAATVPVWAALEHRLDRSEIQPVPTMQSNAVEQTLKQPEEACGPVYVPTVLHERDGSIIGVVYVPDGDNC
jgi:hypothetical protein